MLGCWKNVKNNVSNFNFWISVKSQNLKEIEKRNKDILVK